MLTRRNALGFIAATPFIARPAFGASAEVFAEDGVALRGYDPVAYFTRGTVKKGTNDLPTFWRGVEWHFSNPLHLVSFEAEPERYAPQYGGYCAYAVSQGGLATTDPEAWTIYEDKLYLNYSLPVREIWSQDIPGNIENANANWPGVLG